MKNLPLWYGAIEKVHFEDKGIMSDPILHYGGVKFNYWDIESALYDDFCEWLKNEYSGDEYLETIGYDVGTNSSDFENWLTEDKGEKVRNFLDECIFGGYE